MRRRLEALDFRLRGNDDSTCILILERRMTLGERWRARQTGTYLVVAGRCIAWSPHSSPQSPNSCLGRRSRMLQVRANPRPERPGGHITQESIYAGIDVAKDRLDLALRPSGTLRTVAYDPAGISALVSELQALEPSAVVLVSTGGLELPLAGALAAASLPVAVVNPRQVRDFAKATGRLAKTNALDAQAIAHFAEAVRPAFRPLPDSDTRELHSLNARRTQVVEMPVAEKNRLGRAGQAVRPRIRAHVSEPI